MIMSDKTPDTTDKGEGAVHIVRLAPSDAKRLDDIQKGLDAIVVLLRQAAAQGMPV
jgi:hypothetical protein